MSQLRQAGLPSFGKPPISITWSDFVQIVLNLTIQAYQIMYKAEKANHTWEENVFTERLATFLDPIAFEHSIRVEIRSKVHTEAMREGKQPTIEAKEMDLSMYGVWEKDYRKTRFVWEAKCVGDKRVDKKYSGLNSEYVNEAIYRFIRREYANGMGDAGILGYVLGGDVTNIVNDINSTMGKLQKNSPLSKSNHLYKVPPINNFDQVYRSRHTRIDSTEIQLYHLFLTFDYY